MILGENVSDSVTVRDVSLPGMLQDMILESQDVEEFLTGLAKLVAERFSSRGVDVLCGVTLVRPRTKATVASSSEYAARMDEVQYGFDDGPCLRAAREHKTYVVSDFRTDARFGAYADAISGHGLYSALGIPVPLDGDADAGLDLYAPAADYFGPDDVAEAEEFAREISKSLRMMVRIAKLTDTGRNLKTAMDTRTVIDLAAGIIMGQNRCSQQTAMTILKAASNGRNMKLHDVARGVVSTVTGQSPITHFDS